MKAPRLFLCCAVGALCTSATAASGTEPDYTDATYNIDLPSLPKNRCPVSFKVVIVGGIVNDMANLPWGASIDIINSSSWGGDPDNRTTIESNVQTSVMSSDELRKFHFHVLKDTHLGLPFSISGSFEVMECGPDTPTAYKTEQFEQRELKAENFKVVK